MLLKANVNSVFPTLVYSQLDVGRSRVYGGVVPAPTEKKHRKSVHGAFAELKLEKLPTKEST